MKVLILNGAFAKQNETEALAMSNGNIAFSGIRFQEKIIGGFKDIGADYISLSAPFIAPWKGKGAMFFKGFTEEQNEHTYVNFCNVWGIRNISRAEAIKKKIKDFIKLDDEEKIIVITSPHTPFLQAAAYAKKKDPRIKINLIVPDLPQFMNLSAKVSFIYKIAKKYDISRFDKLLKKIDTFMLLTEQMADALKIKDKPYFVSEGIIENDIFERSQLGKAEIASDGLKYIVYTGVTAEKYGAKNLVNAFLKTTNKDYRLVICGRGDSDEYIREMAQGDARIMPLGLVPPSVAYEWVLKANVVVNPRQNNEEYTKYSFPSKNLEYLASGNSTVCYMLDGMKPIYKDFVNSPSDDSIEALADAIESALNSDSEKKYQDFIRYADTLKAPYVCNKIIEITFEGRK
jgi:glycosyltransferase involved in cell wall biosynthesis